jgi:hypothetical protein
MIQKTVLSGQMAEWPRKRAPVNDRFTGVQGIEN